MTTERTYARPLEAVDGLEVRDADGGVRVVTARKTVRSSDPYMPGHYPGQILYPAVFLLETVRQATTAAFQDTWGDWLEVASVRTLRLIKPMLEGDELTVEITVTPSAELLAARVRAHCGSAQVAEMSVVFSRGPGDAAREGTAGG
ncbi:hypothetical protein ACZ90_48825 [Streptomyces albus subsp. albus]|nr:hypothetical protein ACZ90_48825 [Streptomyces albus subsp. albus]